MTAPHPEHEHLIEQILMGESLEALPEIEACARCRVRLRALQAAAASLEAVGREQRSILAEAEALVDVDGEDRVVDLVREHLGSRPAVRRTIWPTLCVAAAVLLGLLLWASSPERPTDRMMNEAGYRPTGRDVEDLQVKGFQWPATPGAKYVIYIYDPDEEFDPWYQRECSEQECSEQRWVPDQEFVDRMRAVRADWIWLVSTVIEAHDGGPPTITKSEGFGFSFSR